MDTKIELCTEIILIPEYFLIFGKWTCCEFQFKKSLFCYKTIMEFNELLLYVIKYKLDIYINN